MRPSFAPHLLAAGLALALAAPAADAQSSALAREHVEAVRTIYGTDAWKRGAVRDGLPLAALEIDGYAGGALRAAAGKIERVFERPLAPGFVVEAVVADDAAGAHAALVEWLAGLSGTARMPSLGELGVPAGDVGFAGPSGARPGVLSWLAFARGNVAVRLAALDPREAPAPDLAALALRVDAAILARPTLAEGARPAPPIVATLGADRTEVPAGEPVVLDVRVLDPAGGTPALHWTVGGPGQGYVERGPDGVLRLHTTAEGTIDLRLDAIASTGTQATRTLALTVGPEK